MPLSKSELRRELIARRRGMDKCTKKKYDSLIYTKLKELVRKEEPEAVFCYISTPIEVETAAFIQDMLSEGKAVFAPKCMGKNMVFLRVNGISGLKKGAYGIPEPEGSETLGDFQGSICIVPALSYSKSGYRLGYGGGYYDRFLKDYSGISIGICYSEFIGEVPVEVFDERVDIVITEKELFRIGVEE